MIDDETEVFDLGWLGLCCRAGSVASSAHRHG